MHRSRKGRQEGIAVSAFPPKNGHSRLRDHLVGAPSRSDRAAH